VLPSCLSSSTREKAAAIIYKAVDGNLEEGKYLSPDMGGQAKTTEVLEDILRRM
jgi:homoisocitrate dehydrogenase